MIKWNVCWREIRTKTRPSSFQRTSTVIDDWLHGIFLKELLFNLLYKFYSYEQNMMQNHVCCVLCYLQEEKRKMKETLLCKPFYVFTIYFNYSLILPIHYAHAPHHLTIYVLRSQCKLILSNWIDHWDFV